MSEFLKLAERCEQARGNDVHLFRQIGEATYGTRTGDDDDGEPQYSVDNIGPEWWRFEQLIQCDAFLDAAMSLVPEGWSFTIAWLHRNSRATAALFHARLDEQRADAATPALSLCAAALRARAQEPQP